MEFLKLRLAFTTLLLTALAAVCGAAQSQEAEPLSVREMSELSEFRSLLRQGDLQELAWRLMERGDFPRASRVESHIRWVMSHSPEVALSDRNVTGRFETIHLAHNVSAIQKGFTERSDPSAEVFVYRLDRALGLGLVPTTTFRFMESALRSVQIFVHNARSGSKSFWFEDYTDERLYVLDFLTSQMDRNSQNWLRTSTRPVIAIDNSIIKGTIAHQAFSQIGRGLQVLSAQVARPISRAMQLRLEDLQASGQLARMIAETSATIEEVFILRQIDRLLSVSRSRRPTNPVTCSAYFR